VLLLLFPNVVAPSAGFVHDASVLFAPFAPLVPLVFQGFASSFAVHLLLVPSWAYSDDFCISFICCCASDHFEQSDATHSIFQLLFVAICVPSTEEYIGSSAFSIDIDTTYDIQSINIYNISFFIYFRVKN
jgi:hypothetical protein